MGIFEFGLYWDTAAYLFYLAIAGTIAVLCHLGAQQDRRFGIRQDAKRLPCNGWYLLAIVLFTAVYSLRDISVGADTVEYCQFFDGILSYQVNLNEILRLRENEPLFYLYTYGIRRLTANHFWFFLPAGLLMAIGYVSFFRRFWDSDTSYLFILPCCISFQYDMNIMRSGMSTALVLLSYCQLQQERKGRALLFALMAVLFHYTAAVHLIFIIFYNILKRFLAAKNALILQTEFLYYGLLAFGGSVACSIGLRSFFLTTKYQSYLSSGGSLFGYWYILLSALLAIFVLLTDFRNRRVFLSAVTAIYCLMLLPPSIFLGAYRITQYYLVPRLFLWGYAAKRLLNDSIENRYLKSLLCIFAILLYTLFVMSRRSASPGFRYLLSIVGS